MDITVAKKFIKQHIELFGEEIYSDVSITYNNILEDSISTEKVLNNYKLSIENCCKCNLGNSRNLPTDPI